MSTLIILADAGGAAITAAATFGSVFFAKKAKHRSREKAVAAGTQASTVCMDLTDLLNTEKLCIDSLMQKLGPTDQERLRHDTRGALRHAQDALNEYLAYNRPLSNGKLSRRDYNDIGDSLGKLTDKLVYAHRGLEEARAKRESMEAVIANIAHTATRAKTALSKAHAVLEARASEGWNVTQLRMTLHGAKAAYDEGTDEQNARQLMAAQQAFSTSQALAAEVLQQANTLPEQHYALVKQADGFEKSVATLGRMIEVADNMLKVLKARFDNSLFDGLTEDLDGARLQTSHAAALVVTLRQELEPKLDAWDSAQTTIKEITETIDAVTHICNYIDGLEAEFDEEIEQLKEDVDKLREHIKEILSYTLNDDSSLDSGEQATIHTALTKLIKAVNAFADGLGNEFPSPYRLRTQLKKLQAFAEAAERTAERLESYYEEDEQGILAELAIAEQSLFGNQTD